MHLANLFVPPILAITTFWTYMHSRVNRIDKPTGEIIGVFVMVVLWISLVWFLLSAPWFLNLGIAVMLILNNR